MTASLLQRQHAENIVSELFNFIKAQGDEDYIGEAVSQLEHSLQAAHFAEESGADADTILGALLHDIGRFIPAANSMPAMIAPNGTYVGREAHEVIGEKYLRELGFSEKTCQLVGAHVIAKRYLTGVDSSYYDGLSQSSKTTLKFQGGPFALEQIKEAQKDPWLEQKLAVRRWDDMAKEVGLRTAPLDHYHDMAVSSLIREQLGGEEWVKHMLESSAIVLPNFAQYLKSGISTIPRTPTPDRYWNAAEKNGATW